LPPHTIQIFAFRLTKPHTFWERVYMKNHFILFVFLLLASSSLLAEPDWSKEATLAGTDAKWSDQPRTNIYTLSVEEWQKKNKLGLKHAFFYPVTTTQLLIPYEALTNFFSSNPSDPIRGILWQFARDLSHYQSIDDVFKWVGVHSFPEESTQRFPDMWPDLSAEEKNLPMGATLIEKNGVQGLTFSCAACHSADLFGVKVIGLTNRFPRANEFFRLGKKAAPLVNAHLFQALFKLGPEERKMFQNSKAALQSTGVKEPQTLGLDTSLAQVALSLARRNQDEYATASPVFSTFPRQQPLDQKIADSKPAVWWNLKYKTRWLSDGSVVQGNPILTNFLWNEIGRGSDLKQFEGWLNQNEKLIKDLTSAVFASEAPRYIDFFPHHKINIELAKKGETHFKQNCQACHGVYEKDWSTTLTTKVWYHKKTPVIDVGTDPGRYEGMGYFAKELNQLKISKTMKTIVEAQKGYVPPPLVGIWARYPYLHNNSVPSLCALLSSPSSRPTKYVAGPAVDKETDYDHDCLGYPEVAHAPEAWKKNPDYWYDSQKEGLSNQGHAKGIDLSSQEKKELIEFLKTL
jgi:hypothetical protein